MISRPQSHRHLARWVFPLISVSPMTVRWSYLSPIFDFIDFSRLIYILPLFPWDAFQSQLWLAARQVLSIPCIPFPRSRLSVGADIAGVFHPIPGWFAAPHRFALPLVYPKAVRFFSWWLVFFGGRCAIIRLSAMVPAKNRHRWLGKL